MTIQERINWEISALRGWKKVDAGCDCISLVDPAGNIVVTSRHPEKISEYEIDWYADANWPALFREFPKGTHLYAPENPDSTLWALCGCLSQATIRVCQPGNDIGETVAKAWLAFKLGSNLAQDITGSLALSEVLSPGSSSVN